MDINTCNEIENGAQNITPKKKGFAAFKSGWDQVVPLIHKPHISKCCLVFIINFSLLLGLNTFRLWVPQIFAIFSAHEQRNVLEGVSKSASLCTLLEEDVLISQQIENHDSNVECIAVSITGLYHFF